MSEKAAVKGKEYLKGWVPWRIYRYWICNCIYVEYSMDSNQWQSPLFTEF
jgi:hypothetical protein